MVWPLPLTAVAQDLLPVSGAPSNDFHPSSAGAPAAQGRRATQQANASRLLPPQVGTAPPLPQASVRTRPLGAVNFKSKGEMAENTAKAVLPVVPSLDQRVAAGDRRGTGRLR